MSFFIGCLKLHSPPNPMQFACRCFQAGCQKHLKCVYACKIFIFFLRLCAHSVDCIIISIIHESYTLCYVYLAYIYFQFLLIINRLTCMLTAVMYCLNIYPWVCTRAPLALFLPLLCLSNWVGCVRLYVNNWVNPAGNTTSDTRWTHNSMPKWLAATHHNLNASHHKISRLSYYYFSCMHLLLGFNS